MKEVHLVKMVQVEDDQEPFYPKKHSKEESNGRREQVTPLTLEKIMRSFNEWFIKVKEEENQINVVIL